MSNTDLVVPLSQVIISTAKEMNDLEWSGDLIATDKLKYQLEYLHHLEAQGEVWYTKF